MPGESLLLDEDQKLQLRAELRQVERELTEASLVEALRLLESPRFEEVTEQHVREISEYRPIEIAGESFFERAFSRSKEAGALLGFALLLGAEGIRADLEHLRASISGQESAPRPSSPREPDPTRPGSAGY